MKQFFLLLTFSLAVLLLRAQNPTVGNSKRLASATAGVTFENNLGSGGASASALTLGNPGTAGGTAFIRTNPNTTANIFMDATTVIVSGDLVASSPYDMTGEYNDAPEVNGGVWGSSNNRTNLITYDNAQIGSGALVKNSTTVTIGNNQIQTYRPGGVAYPSTYIGVTSDAPTGRTYILDVNNLVINKTMGTNAAPGSGLTPNVDIFLGKQTNIEIEGTTAFTSGRIYTDPSAKVVFKATATSPTGGSINSYVDGTAEYLGNAASFLLPLGDDSTYQPLTLKNNTLTGASFSETSGGPVGGAIVSYLRAAPGGTVSAPLASVSTISSYITTGSTSSAALSFPVTTANFGNFTDPTTLTIVGLNSSGNWVIIPSTVSGGVATSTGSVNLSTFNKISIGSTSPVDVLPITWMSFTAQPAATTALLNWTVGVQIAKTYSVQHSTNGANFTTIGSLAGTDALAYNYTDAAPVQGINYYRIQGVEADGNITYSTIQPVSFGANGATTVQVYPNPVVTTTNVVIANTTGSTATLHLYDILGNQLLAETIATNTSGNTTQTINLSGFSKGVYILKVSTNMQTIGLIKIVKQ